MGNNLPNGNRYAKADPEEKTNLFKQDASRAEAMVKRYKQLSSAIPFVKAEGGKPVKSD